MVHRSALLLAWLEGETERQSRPILPPPRSMDPRLHGWIQVIVCAVAGTLVLGVSACWLATAWAVSMRLNAVNLLRQEGIRRLAEDQPPRPWKFGEGELKSDRGEAGRVLFDRALAVAVGTVIGSLFLLAGCVLYNRLVGGEGSPGGVPPPTLGKAMAITFVTALMGATLGFGPLSAVVSFLAMAGMISALLPTTFTRGLLVALCYLLVGFCVVVALASVFFWLNLLR